MFIYLFVQFTSFLGSFGAVPSFTKPCCSSQICSSFILYLEQRLLSKTTPTFNMRDYNSFDNVQLEALYASKGIPKKSRPKRRGIIHDFIEHDLKIEEEILHTILETFNLEKDFEGAKTATAMDDQTTFRQLAEDIKYMATCNAAEEKDISDKKSHAVKKANINIVADRYQKKMMKEVEERSAPARSMINTNTFLGRGAETQIYDELHEAVMRDQNRANGSTIDLTNVEVDVSPCTRVYGI
jgi:hypothetical protein